MNEKLSIALIVFLSLCLSGVSILADSYPEPGPSDLGGQYPAYKAPEDPSDGADPPAVGADPEGVLSLESALEFALMYSPELAASACMNKADFMLGTGVILFGSFVEKFFCFFHINRACAAIEIHQPKSEART